MICKNVEVSLNHEIQVPAVASVLSRRGRRERALGVDSHRYRRAVIGRSLGIWGCERDRPACSATISSSV